MTQTDQLSYTDRIPENMRRSKSREAELTVFAVKPLNQLRLRYMRTSTPLTLAKDPLPDRRSRSALFRLKSTIPMCLFHFLNLEQINILADAAELLSAGLKSVRQAIGVHVSSALGDDNQRCGMSPIYSSNILGPRPGPEHHAGYGVARDTSSTGAGAGKMNV